MTGLSTKAAQARTVKGDEVKRGRKLVVRQKCQFL